MNGGALPRDHFCPEKPKTEAGNGTGMKKEIEGYVADDPEPFSLDEAKEIADALSRLAFPWQDDPEVAPEKLTHDTFRDELAMTILIFASGYTANEDGEWCIDCRNYRGLRWMENGGRMSRPVHPPHGPSIITTYCHASDTGTMQYSGNVEYPFQCPYDYCLWEDGRNALPEREFTELTIGEIATQIAELRETGVFEEVAGGVTKVWVRPFHVRGRWEITVDGSFRWYGTDEKPRTYLKGNEEDAVRSGRTIRDFLEDTGISVEGAFVIGADMPPGSPWANILHRDG